MWAADAHPLEGPAHERVFEADEAYWPKHECDVDGTRFVRRIYTVAVLDRASGQIRILVVLNRSAGTMTKALWESGVRAGSTLYSDGLRTYQRVARTLVLGHASVDHSKGEYVNVEDPSVHINGVEAVFAWMRRALGRVETSQGNLQRYADQVQYVFNRRRACVKDVLRDLASVTIARAPDA